MKMNGCILLPSGRQQKLLEDLKLQAEIERIRRDKTMSEQEKLEAIARLLRKQTVRDLLEGLIVY